nr:fructosamine kinase family protein [uncultured Mucilaginibacter sp.]
MIDKAVIASAEAALSAKITGIKPVSGGDINAVYSLQTANDKYLVKINSALRFPEMFRCEADGLAAIRNTGAVKTPNVIVFGETAGYSFLIMEWIEAGPLTDIGLARLGEGLANLHHTTSPAFGYHEDSYMGSLKQSNQAHSDWSAFYISERLEPLMVLAHKNGKLQTADLQKFDRIFAKLPTLFEPESPALLHGDLWSGNFIIDKQGQPYLIDPAVYYGHREIDIALTTLFGGFGQAFYDAYQYHYPLSKGADRRTKLWCLYPLLVHVNLFGGGYVQQLRSFLQIYL